MTIDNLTTRKHTAWYESEGEAAATMTSRPFQPHEVYAAASICLGAKADTRKHLCNAISTGGTGDGRHAISTFRIGPSHYEQQHAASREENSFYSWPHDVGPGKQTYA